jgi:hypothetical protein
MYLQKIHIENYRLLTNIDIGFTITSFLPYASIFDKFVFKAGWQS